MTRSLDCLKCTFVIVLMLCVISIFIGILLEEWILNHEEDFDYVLYHNEQSTRKSRITTIPVIKGIPVISRVKLPNHNQEDPELVKDLASKILPPCPHLKEYAQYKPEEGRIGYFEHIRKISNNKGGRFFLECGAGDGESLSNTLVLEKYTYWEGLLVEADPVHLKDLIRVHRKAWIAPVCMSLNTSAYVAHFKSSPVFEGKVITTNESLEEEEIVKVVCYPFYTFLLALNRTRIDYLSLGVVGHEMEILETIPFHKLDIGFISVDVSKARGGSEGVKHFMLRSGYDLVDEYPPSELIFVNMDEDYW